MVGDMLTKFFVDPKCFGKLLDTQYSIILDSECKVIESLRLVVRPFGKSDIEHYYTLYSDIDVIASYHNGLIRSRHAVEELVNYSLNFNSPGYFSIFHKMTNSFVGTIALTTRKQKAGEILLVYLLNKKYWGYNYAKEAIYSILFCFFPTLKMNVKTVNATTNANNIASKLILERFGFGLTKNLNVFGKKKLYYTLDIEVICSIHKKIRL